MAQPASIEVLPIHSSSATATRIRVEGKFLFSADKKFYAKGVTYGTFRPDEHGQEYHDRALVERDFSQMAANGINTVRVYTVPPRWLLDIAGRCGLYVIVGLPWEQHIAFLDNKGRAASIIARVRDGVRVCAGHPAVLCYAIGNEIPASIVRWHGAKAVQRFLRCLADAVKEEDPDALVTYVNYPTTEYLDLPFLDLVCFNVYLESRDRLEAYLARLQNLAGNRPLLMAEVGLDSLRNGEHAQAETLAWQIRSIFAAGCAGMTIFSWTDEWHRGGYDIDDWHFGLTTRNRKPKPALEVVRHAYAKVPFLSNFRWPSVSVVVCSYNGSRTIGETLSRLQQLRYPAYEIIVVNDGSTDRTLDIARGFSVRVIDVPNGGLSKARNLGVQQATGEIVAYIDDDAYPDPDWLHYLAYTFLTTDHAAVGGPNIPVPGDGPVADCVANSPGGPTHVLISDQLAEHVPGCNMAFRRECLIEIGGFDPQFRVAGDDVDLCWRLQQREWTIGFNPGAVVWHHRRNSVRAYLKQQFGYGKAEALLEQKWPQKYNSLGHPSWTGRVYGPLISIASWRSRIYQGSWGLAPFQRVYEQPSSQLESLMATPDWYLVNGLLFALCCLGAFWKPMLAFAPLLLLSSLAPFFGVLRSASRAHFVSKCDSRSSILRLRVLTVLLHVLQPLVRLWGRTRYGLLPWRRWDRVVTLPLPHQASIWSELWRSPEVWLEELEAALVRDGPVIRGGDYDRWDFEISGGVLGAFRVRMAIEEHGGGKQLLRFQATPKLSWAAALPTTLFSALVIAAAVAGNLPSFTALGLITAALVLWIVRDLIAAKAATVTAFSVVSHR